MIAPKPKSLCQQAEPYYYDFLCVEIQELIPEPIISHIQHCKSCQKQVSQLQAVLSESREHLKFDEREVCSAITEMLKLHFAYIDKPVTCKIAKPFLPTLLDPALEVRIPTPITVHLDKCRHCSEDLEIVRGLNLSHAQLRRLSQLFADKDTRHGISCSQAHAAILKVLAMNLEETNAEDLKHLCMCPYCRKLLYQYREALCKEFQDKKTGREFPCEEVSESDIFDYVMPYGLDPANDQYAKFRESLISHFRDCPTCLAKVQKLHDSVYRIVERAESEAVTIFHIDEFVKAKAISESNDLYSGFPIKVEVINRKDKVRVERTDLTIDFGAPLNQKFSAKKLKPLFKTAVAAAAVILIAFALFLNIPTAKAVTLERIYRAIENVKNVYIASFVTDKKEPIQEQWVSRLLNVNKIRTEKESVLWDLTNKVKKVRHLDNNSVETTTLSPEVIAGIHKTITGSLGLMPFYDISEIPADAKWNRVDKASLEVNESIEAYDLIWIDRNNINLVVFNKWRIFVDSETNLPQRTEFYQKVSDEIEYTLYSAKVVEYLSDSEMQEVIKKPSF